MRKPLFTKNAKVGYALAITFLVIAAGLLIADWMFWGSAAAGTAFTLAIDTASAHGHLSKRKDENKSI